MWFTLQISQKRPVKGRCGRRRAPSNPREKPKASWKERKRRGEKLRDEGGFIRGRELRSEPQQHAGPQPQRDDGEGAVRLLPCSFHATILVRRQEGSRPLAARPKRLLQIRFRQGETLAPILPPTQKSNLLVLFLGFLILMWGLLLFAG